MLKRIIFVSIVFILFPLTQVSALTPTVTTVTLLPSSVNVNSTTTVTVVVTGTLPSGTVSFTFTGGSGSFSSNSCILSLGTCNVTFTPTSAASVTIKGNYSGDLVNSPSSGTAPLTVTSSTTTTTTDTISISMAPSVSTTSTVFHQVTTADTVGISMAPASSNSSTTFHPVTTTDTVGISMAPSGSTNVAVFHPVTTADTVGISMAPPSASTASTLFNPVTPADTVGISMAPSVSTNLAVFHPVTTADMVAIGFSTPASASTGSITIQTKSSVLVPGATYSISPNPSTGSGILTVSDGGPGDMDGSNNGIIKISNVQTGVYNITQTVAPAGFTSLLKSSIITAIPQLSDPTVAFQLASVPTDLSQLPPTSIASPFLNSTTLGTWITSFSANTVNSSATAAVTNVNQLPQIIIAGKSNTTAINAATSSQSSVLLNTSFPPLTGGSTIINTFDVTPYTLTDSTSVASVIPTIVTTVNSTSGQVISTPPITIIPGQEMVIPVTDSLIPSFGGLKEIDLQSTSSATSTGGTAPSEWFVAEVNNKIPSSITSSGIKGTFFLFVNIQYPFEQTGVGFNWGNPGNFVIQPTLTLVVNKTSLASIQKDPLGCPVVQPYTLSSGTWTTNGLAELASTSISPTKCQVKIETPHFSKFAFSMAHIGSISSNTGLSGPGTVSAGVAGGGGGGSIGIVQEASAQSSPVSVPVAANNQEPDLSIYKVSYDICKDKMVRIFVDTDSPQVPRVMLRSSTVQTWAELSTDQTSADLSTDQTSGTQGSNPNMNRFVFDVPVETNYKSFEAIALVKTGNGIYSTGQTIEITACQGNVTFGSSISPISDVTSTGIAPLVRVMPISDITKIEPISDTGGRIIAYPTVLYSSLKHNDDTMYKVTAPDGTCVIGPSENCLVTQSTQLLPGHIKTVTIGGQKYMIRYSGPDDPLERFSISSAQPIVGQWNVELDSQNGGILNITDSNETDLRIRYVPAQ